MKAVENCPFCDAEAKDLGHVYQITHYKDCFIRDHLKTKRTIIDKDDKEKLIRWNERID